MHSSSMAILLLPSLVLLKRLEKKELNRLRLFAKPSRARDSDRKSRISLTGTAKILETTSPKLLRILNLQLKPKILNSRLLFQKAKNPILSEELLKWSPTTLQALRFRPGKPMDRV